ncbi:MAG: serine/threonine-protein kinase [Planctomycetales bacterium]
MLEPPSPQLVSLLRELQICTSADFRRCRGRVRKLASDLPAFDSVWIDALVQSGKLTPFQAQILESSHPEGLQVGGSLLVNLLGKGLAHETYIARPVGSHELIALKLIPGEDVFGENVQARLKKLVGEIKPQPHPHIVGPHALERSARGVVLLSRYVPGQTLQEMLIRRGRFSAAVVAEIARQLLNGLRDLHQRGLVHGEILLRNVRLTEGGVAVLVDAGVQPAVSPELIPHTHLNPERVDGIAPELIGTGQVPTASSDLYALGCLLWQLLAGRPPFPGGDSLAKLAIHRAKRIEDVRELAPGTPAPLAELIRQLTSPDPRQRSATFAHVLNSGRESERVRKRHLARFVRNFRHPSNWNDEGAGRQTTTTWVMLLGFLLLGLGVTIADFEARTQLWDLVAGLPAKFLKRDQVVAVSSGLAAKRDEQGKSPVTSTRLVASRIAQGANAAQGLKALPAPNATGVIQLDGNMVYEAGEVNVVGPLTIMGDGKQRARIIVTDVRHMLNLTATKVELNGLEIEWRQASAERGDWPRALAKVRAQKVVLRDCRLNTENSARESAAEGRGIPAVAWKGIDPLPGGNQLLAENCELIGPGTAFFFDNQVARASLKNVLKVSAGELCRLGDETAGSFTDLHLEEVTCRQSGSLLQVSPAWIEARLKRSRPMTLTARNCIFDLQPKTAAVLEFSGALAPATGWQGMFQIQGEDSLCSPPLQIALWRNAESGIRALNGSQVALEGIIETKFRFAGNTLRIARQSEVAQWDSVPRTAHDPPGYRDLSRTERMATKGLQAN